MIRQIECSRGGAADLPALHRIEPGPRGDGGGPRALPLDELPRQWVGAARCAADAAHRVSLIGPGAPERQAAYRALFRAQLDGAAINDIRLALNQSQPLGNSRFLDKIEKITGVLQIGRAHV